jgi:hypothetical protein
MIDGFEPIPCEHRYGPSYRLSPLDRENFRARCRELRERQGVDIAGFFRSSTRESLQVTAEDAALVRELLSEAAGVVLIQPFLSGDAIFRVFQPAQDSDWREFEEFRCFGDEVVVAPRPVPPPAAVRMGAAAAVPVMTRAAAPEIAPRTSFGEPRPRKVFARDWMSVLLVISFLAFASALLVVATRSLWNNAPQTARASSPDLAMQIAWQGDSLRLTWDRSLPSVRNSTGANLQIQDGKQYREVALDSTQVAQAVVYYTPASDDVTFHLNIRGREPAEVAGIARMLAVRPGAVPPPVSQPVRSAPRREVQPRPEASDPPPTRGAPQQPLPTGAEASPLPITPGVPSQPPVSSRPNAAPSTEEKKAEVSEIRKPVETEPPAPAPPKAADAVPLRAQNVPAAPVIPPAVAPRPPLTSVSPRPPPPRPPHTCAPGEEGLAGETNFYRTCCFDTYDRHGSGVDR